MDATLMKLTDEERAWVEAQLAVVDRFVGDFSSTGAPADAMTGSLADALAEVDQAWAAWLADGGEKTAGYDADTIMNAVAVALGQSVVDALAGFTWVTVFQDGETDLGVTGLPTVDALFLPAEIVALEYAARNPTFLVQTRDHYVASVNDGQP